MPEKLEADIISQSWTFLQDGTSVPTFWMQPTIEWRLWKNQLWKNSQKGPFRVPMFLFSSISHSWTSSPIYMTWDVQTSSCPFLSCPDQDSSLWSWTPCFPSKELSSAHQYTKITASFLLNKYT